MLITSEYFKILWEEVLPPESDMFYSMMAGSCNRVSIRQMTESISEYRTPESLALGVIRGAIISEQYQ